MAYCGRNALCRDDLHKALQRQQACLPVTRSSTDCSHFHSLFHEWLNCLSLMTNMNRILSWCIPPFKQLFSLQDPEFSPNLRLLQLFLKGKTSSDEQFNDTTHSSQVPTPGCFWPCLLSKWKPFLREFWNAWRSCGLNFLPIAVHLLPLLLTNVSVQFASGAWS